MTALFYVTATSELCNCFSIRPYFDVCSASNDMTHAC